MQEITAENLVSELKNLKLDKETGYIVFNYYNLPVTVTTTDTVGITLQAWLKEYLKHREYIFCEPDNTQEFPDFYLSKKPNKYKMLEVKAFNSCRTPAFDIANFESYCESVKNIPERLNADYLILGYEMKKNGAISIPKIWLHKIWEIAGTSKSYPLKVQVKRNVIYNIRPNSNFKNNKKSPFENKEDFLEALYLTLRQYRGKDFANDWKKVLNNNYKKCFEKQLGF